MDIALSGGEYNIGGGIAQLCRTHAGEEKAHGIATSLFDRPVGGKRFRSGRRSYPGNHNTESQIQAATAAPQTPSSSQSPDNEAPTVPDLDKKILENNEKDMKKKVEQLYQLAKELKDEVEKDGLHQSSRA